MFAKKNQFDLPLSSSSSVRGGADSISTFRLRLPKVSNYTFISWLWLLTSLGLIVFSYSSCSGSASYVRLVCPPLDPSNCSVSMRQAYMEPTVLSLKKVDLLATEQVRVDNEGKLVDIGPLSRRERRNLGYSYSLSYIDRDEMENIGTTSPLVKKIAMSKGSIGRKNAKSKWMKLSSFIKGEVSDIDIKETRFFTLLGTMGMIAGFMSAMLSGVLGQFVDEPEEKVTKKRH